TYVNLGLLDPDYSLEGFIYQTNLPSDNILLYTLLALLVGTSAVIIVGWNWNRQLVSAVAQQTQQPTESDQYNHRLEDTADRVNMDQRMMKPSLGDYPIAYLLILSGGVMVSILGVSVLFGWVTHNVALIQVSTAFVPMQFNTALGFLLSGLGVLVVTRGWRGAGMIIGIVVMLIGLLTLVEYIFGIDLGIDQLLMKQDITLLMSHPGRMAPNTALCFLLVGAALAVQSARLRVWKASMFVGILGSLVLGLSLVALSGYAFGIETAFGWGEMTRMAVHTASGFIFLGLAVICLTLHRGTFDSTGLPFWFPIPVGIGVVTMVISLWQALEAQEVVLMKKYGGMRGDFYYVNEIMLVIGIVLAVALSLAAYLAQTSRNRERQLGVINRRILAEIDERKMVEMALRESEERWQFALKGNQDGVWDWNVVTNEIFFSARWKEMLGFEEGEIENSFDEWEKRVHPDDLEQAHADVAKHLNHITPFYENQHRMLCKDSSYKWILARGKIISWTDDHKPQRMIGTHTDITEQKLAKEALELSEELFRTIFEEA
ncbi:MAG: PAS domain-containing protein, partial [Methylococcales bacterium]|nr:PAS domain-containing protein [Methylococcales bacterium]